MKKLKPTTTGRHEGQDGFPPEDVKPDINNTVEALHKLSCPASSGRKGAIPTESINEHLLGDCGKCTRRVENVHTNLSHNRNVNC